MTVLPFLTARSRVAGALGARLLRLLEQRRLPLLVCCEEGIASFLAANQATISLVHSEWITLHDNPGFRGFVDFLRAELDRVGPAQADLCHDFFRRAVALELSFFAAAYADRT